VTENKALHDRAAELIPELSKWNDGSGIDLESWVTVVGRYDHAIAYATIFWPDFVVHDGCVFRHRPSEETYGKWLASLDGDRSKVESVINHLHITDMFTSEGVDPTPRVLMHVAQLLKDMWSCKLDRDFPGRGFCVEIYEGKPDDLLAYEITFFQSFE
jgi:hypothetical protein